MEQDYGRNSRLRLARPAATLVISALLCSLAGAACCVATVIVDVKAQSVKSDDDKLVTKWIRQKGEQIGFIVQNTLLEPREFLAKVTGLADQNYDLYINSGYVGAKSAKELEAGLQLRADGTIADPDMMRCLKAVQPLVDAEYLRLLPIKDPEPARVEATLQQAVSWVRSAIKTEQVFRYVIVTIAPAGRVLEPMSGPVRLDANETARTITRSCWFLQQARARMASVIKDPDLRNSAVAAMTPVDLTTSYAVKNGKPHVEVVITNDCNLPVTGKITAAIPKGWKWNAKNTAFQDLKSGKTYKLSFDLSRTAGGASLPEGVKMAATMNLVQEWFAAEYQVKTIARTPTPESATKPRPGVKLPLPVAPPGAMKPIEVPKDR